MAVQKFEDLLVWQKSQDLAVTVYKVFIDNKDFSFRDQTMLYLSIRLNFLDKEKAGNLIESTNEISKMLHGLIKSIKK